MLVMEAALCTYEHRQLQADELLRVAWALATTLHWLNQAALQIERPQYGPSVGLVGRNQGLELCGVECAGAVLDTASMSGGHGAR